MSVVAASNTLALANPSLTPALADPADRAPPAVVDTLPLTVLAAALTVPATTDLPNVYASALLLLLLLLLLLKCSPKLRRLCALKARH